MKKILIGNWKMNGSVQDARALIAAIVNGLDEEPELLKRFDFAVCPPALHIPTIRHALVGFPKIRFGAQDCAAQDDGAFTGDLSARMLADSSCSYVILGHSERRQHHGESDALVCRKVAQALAHDLVPVVCIGETEAERAKGQALAVCTRQLEQSLPRLTRFQPLIIAYEPVWAIGTGKTPSLKDIGEMHGHIHGWMAGQYPGFPPVPVLYGGSLKPENAGDILAAPGVDGGLIGGASLKAETFLGIARKGIV